MKIFTILNLILFSFSAGNVYTAQDYTCDHNEIRVKYEENWYTLSLFNVSLHKDSNICGYVYGDVSFEFDEAVAIDEKNAAYIYVDDLLLQEMLIEKDMAEVEINSLAYKYQFEKKEEVIANVKEKKEQKYYSRSISYIFFSIYSILLCFYIGYKKHMQKDINIEENDV